MDFRGEVPNHFSVFSSCSQVNPISHFFLPKEEKMESAKEYILSGFNYLIALQSRARLVLNILQFPTGQYYEVC